MDEIYFSDLSNNEISSSVEDIDGGFVGLDSIEEL